MTEWFLTLLYVEYPRDPGRSEAPTTATRCGRTRREMSANVLDGLIGPLCSHALWQSPRPGAAPAKGSSNVHENEYICRRPARLVPRAPGTRFASAVYRGGIFM